MTQHPQSLPTTVSPVRQSVGGRIAGWLHQHEPLRRTLQTAAAVGAAYVLAMAVRLPEPSWAVFSALFVVQDSVGGTVTSAMHRILGAVLGLVLGVAALTIIGNGEWRSLVALVGAVGAMTYIAARWPQTQYGLVTVAILTLAPGRELFEEVVLTALTIAVGAVCGAAAGVLVLPVPAHRSALLHLGRATEACGRLLEAAVLALTREGRADLLPLHEEIGAELDRARDMISQSRYRVPAAPRVPSQMELLRHVDRLRYTLALVDRLSSMHLPKEAGDIVGAAERTAKAYRQYLARLGTVIWADSKQDDLPTAPPDHGEIFAAIDAMGKHRPLAETDRELAESLFTLAFAWEQVHDSVAALAQCADKQPRSRGQARR